MRTLPKGRMAKTIIYVFLIVLCITFIFPFFWMVSTSLKYSNEILTWPPTFWPEKLNWKNYSDVVSQINIGKMYLNSIYIAVVTTIGQVFFSAVAGFAFAKLRFKGRNFLFICYVGTMMVPSMVTLIPRYVLMSQLGWVNKHISVIAPVLLGTPFAVFLTRQFFMTLPQQLMEAAVIDGASYPRVFFQIYLPLMRPILSTLGIFCFMGAWNDFLWPLITLQSQNLKTLPVGLAAFQGMYGVQYNLLMAGAVLSVIPVFIVFLFAQKQFINGIALTGMKG